MHSRGRLLFRVPESSWEESRVGRLHLPLFQCQNTGHEQARTVPGSACCLCVVGMPISPEAIFIKKKQRTHSEMNHRQQ